MNVHTICNINGNSKPDEIMIDMLFKYHSNKGSYKGRLVMLEDSVMNSNTSLQ